jgi:hypothetical protein
VVEERMSVIKGRNLPERIPAHKGEKESQWGKEKHFLIHRAIRISVHKTDESRNTGWR